MEARFRARDIQRIIERERNSVLKEYRSDVHPLDAVPVALKIPIVPLNGGESKFTGQVLYLDKNVYRPLLEGPWEGDDSRDVLREALEWWGTQLDAIDAEVKCREKTFDRARFSRAAFSAL